MGIEFQRKGVLIKKGYQYGLIVEDGIQRVSGCVPA